MKKVVIGIIGSGFAAGLHLEAYQYVRGIEIQIKAISSLAPNLREYANAHGISDIYTDYREMLNDPEISLIDIIVPPALHTQCILDALHAGKHVICEKPLTGYFGKDKDPLPIGKKVDRQKMMDTVMEEMNQLKKRSCCIRKIIYVR